MAIAVDESYETGMSKRDDADGRVTRRRFLTGTGTTAATGVALDGCKPPEPVTTANAGGEASEVGPGAVALELRINGATEKLEVEPRTTLADALRERLGMTGTKVVCDRGACSACTVWLDDVPVNACMTFVLDAADREITTIEGLAKGERLDPVQEAFIAHDATQCGFCTPGMVMSCAALLRRNPTPSLDDVKSAVSGNLCRCGTYPKVFRATLDAAKKG